LKIPRQNNALAGQSRLAWTDSNPFSQNQMPLKLKSLGDAKALLLIVILVPLLEVVLEGL